MHYFLVDPNNELRHLPGFHILAPGQPSKGEVALEWAYGIPNDKELAYFVCTQQPGEVPSSFLVVDENMVVHACTKVRLLEIGDRERVLTGIVSAESGMPPMNEVLKAIQKAIAAITNDSEVTAT